MIEEPWDFFTWEDIYEDHKYFVQQTFKEDKEARNAMCFIVASVGCESANRIEKHCLSRLKQIIDEFKEKNKDKEPEECDWLDFVFHYNTLEPLQETLLQDEFLKKEFAAVKEPEFYQTLEYIADAISTAIVKDYNLMLNLRTKATWNWQ